MSTEGAIEPRLLEILSGCVQIRPAHSIEVFNEPFFNIIQERGQTEHLRIGAYVLFTTTSLACRSATSSPAGP